MPGFVTGWEETQRLEDAHQMNQLAIQQQRMNIASQENMAQLLQQEAAKGDPQKPGSIMQSDHLARMSELAAQAGRIDDAYKLSAMASTARIHEANAAYKETSNILRLNREAETLMAGVTDEASWNRNNAMYELLHGRPSPFAGIPYSPENMQAIRDGIQYDKEVANAAEKRARIPLIEQQTKSAKARQALDEAKTTTEETTKRSLQKAQADAAEARAKHVAKVGGPGRKTPPAQQLKAVTDLIQHDFPELDADPEQARNIGRPIAERAQEIMVSHPGMRATEAITQAYGEAQQAGTFEGYMRAAPRRPKASDLPPLPEGFQLDVGGQ